MNKYLF